MPIQRTTLELHKDITFNTTDESQIHTPPSGEFTIVDGGSSAAYDLNCVVRIEWDGVTVWHGKGGETLRHAITKTGDGVKILKLVLDATDLGGGSVMLGGFVKVEQEI